MFTVNLVGGRGGVSVREAQLAQQITETAAEYWARYIDFSLADIEIDLFLERDDPNILASASPATFVNTGVRQGGTPVQESQVALELRDGTDSNGGRADMEIFVNTRLITSDEFFLVDFSEATIDTLPDVPRNQIDLFGTLTHEIAHGLGLYSLVEDRNGEISTMDTFINVSGQNVTFTGGAAVEVFGGPVPLPSRTDRSHFNDSTNDLLDAFAPDNGRSLISALDVAFFDDLDLPIIRATVGDDTLYGFETVDDIRGRAGDDIIVTGAGDDSLFGNTGDDILNGGRGADRLVGGGGNDTADYSNAEARVRADLLGLTTNSGEATGDQFTSIENLSGSANIDRLYGDNSGNALTGNGGDDFLYGRLGDDVLNGGDGADRLIGGGGNDTADYGNADARIRADLLGLTTNSGEAAGDQYSSIENLSGSSNADGLRGSNRDNILSGNDGNDIIYGRDGDDTLIGGRGNDRLIGGEDDDSFVFTNGDGADTIVGFSDGSELITFTDTGLAFADLTITDRAAGAEVDYGSGTILMRNIESSQLTADDFEFV